MQKADLTIDAPLPEPRFRLFEDEPAFLETVFRRLGPHGLRLGDIRIDHGAPLADQISCHLINYWMTVRFKLDRVEIVCSELPRNYLEAFSSAIPQALSVAMDLKPSVHFSGITTNIGLHGTIDNRDSREYLKTYVRTPPLGLGPDIGNGVVYYFGAEEGRVNGSALIDMSAVIPGGVFVRVYAAWDGAKVPIPELFQAGQSFVDRVLASFAVERA